jgi:transposase
VVGAVSINSGLEGYLVKQKSINSDSFIEFLQHLLERNDPINTVLFMDNCSVHHSRKVKNFCESVNLKVIFNIPYCPQFNPIERVWAIVKNTYKRRKLKFVSYKDKKKHENLVRQCMDSISEKQVRSICEKTLMNEILSNL